MSDIIDDLRRKPRRGVPKRKNRLPRGVAVGMQEAREGLARALIHPEVQRTYTWRIILASILIVAVVRTIHSHPEWSWWSIIVFALGVLHTGGLVAAVHALLTAHSSQAAIAWSISLITFPWVALPLYLLLGRNRFEGYRQAFAAGRLRHTGYIADLVIGPMKAFGVGVPADPASDDPARARRDRLEAMAVYENLARVPFTGHNRVDLLIDGETTYTSMFDAIHRAEKYVLACFFIVNDDEVGRAFQRRLIERARAGVKVVFVYDDWGSWWLTRRFLDDMREAGVEVHAFTSGEGLYNKLQMNFRNHRKVLVIDGHEALVGGFNIGEEQLGIDRYYGPWRDTHLRIQGPAVMGVQLVFLEDYHWASGGKMLDLDWTPRPAAPSPRKGVSDNQVDALYLATGPNERIQVGLLYFLHAINCARKRLWISSPYFVPDASVLDALKLASLRGVDVRILLAGRYDHLYMDLAAKSYWPELDEETDIQIFVYPAYCHQKVILVDDWLACVGSANLDNRSMRLNFEANMVTASPDFAARVARMLETDFSRSHLVTREDVASLSWYTRLGARFCRLFDSIL